MTTGERAYDLWFRRLFVDYGESSDDDFLYRPSFFEFRWRSRHRNDDDDDTMDRSIHECTSSYTCRLGEKGFLLYLPTDSMFSTFSFVFVSSFIVRSDTSYQKRISAGNFTVNSHRHHSHL